MLAGVIGESSGVINCDLIGAQSDDIEEIDERGLQSNEHGEL
jgi:hypothetical protein